MNEMVPLNKPPTFRVIDELEIEERAPARINYTEESESAETPLQNASWESNDTLRKMKRRSLMVRNYSTILFKLVQFAPHIYEIVRW